MKRAMNGVGKFVIGSLAATLTTADTTQEEILSYAAGIATAIEGNTHARKNKPNGEGNHERE